jgi:hypothetical protein
MIGRLLTLAILLAAGYWYWSGPYQQQRNPDAQQQLEKAIEDMRECIRGQNYKAGATGVSEGNPEQICAEKYKLYLYEGEWRSSQ